MLWSTLEVRSVRQLGNCTILFGVSAESYLRSLFQQFKYRGHLDHVARERILPNSTLVEATIIRIMRRLPRSLLLGYDWLERVKGVMSCGSERTLTIEHLGVKSCAKLNSDCKIDTLWGEANAATINALLNQITRLEENIMILSKQPDSVRDNGFHLDDSGF